MVTVEQVERVAQALFDRLCARCKARGHEPHHRPGTLVASMPPSYRDDYMDDARAALEAAAGQDGWQPIETAPKGEMFIYYQPRDGKRCIGLAYLAKDGGWRDSEGDWSKRLDPTHWVPLPEPPVAGNGEVSQ